MTGCALNGIKVVEFAHDVSGPYCGKLLADMGADVIKVEPPEGDSSRLAGPFPNSEAHPEKSGLFMYLNTNKRGVVLDVKHQTDREKFIALLKWADLVIDNHPADHMANLDLGFEELKKINPKLVYTSITPYGRTGRRANVKGGELTLQHAGGLANLLPTRCAHVDTPPVKLGGHYIAGYHGGVYSAVVSLAAVMDAMHTGKGCMIDVSLHEVVVSLVSTFATNSRYMHTTWNRVPDRPPATGRMETSDGYIILGAADDHHFRKFRELVGKPEWCESDDWDNMQYRTHHLMDIAPQMDAWMKKQKKHDVFHRAAKMGIPIAPLLSVKEVLEDQQYAARNYFVDVYHPIAGKYKYAGWPYKMTASPPRVSSPAPLLGQHTQEVFDQETSDGENTIAILEEKTQTTPLPSLKGLRILDFSWVVAGPYASRFLAEFGMDVIKVEGHKRIELLRRSFPWPLPEPAPRELGINQSMLFNCTNNNKKSVTIDLTKPEGIAIAKKLVEMSDVVMDNMRPGAMDKLGLGYKDLVKIRPDIIVLNSSSRGLNGPLSEYLGFAIIHQSHGGIAYVSGHPEDHPTPGSPADADCINAMTSAYAILAAVHYRMKTGKGQFIDFSQTEGVSTLIGEMFLDYQMTSRVPERQGNRHPTDAPHNVYRCWGVDRWLALETHSDEEFAVLAKIINMPELITDNRFANMALRKKNEEELDRIIGAWIRQRDRDWMVEEFCKYGLAAAPSRDARDIYADRHLKDRGSFVTVDHPELGPLEIQSSTWKIDGHTPEVKLAPLLGEHNQYVLQELLGLDDNEIAALRKKDIIL